MARTSNNGGEGKAPKAPAKTPARRRSDKARQAAVAANDSGRLTASVAVLAAAGGGFEPNPAEVQRLAYALYMQRGCCDGYDKEDWYEAERRLREQHV